MPPRPFASAFSVLAIWFTLTPMRLASIARRSASAFFVTTYTGLEPAPSPGTVQLRSTAERVMPVLSQTASKAASSSSENRTCTVRFLRCFLDAWRRTRLLLFSALTAISTPPFFLSIARVCSTRFLANAFAGKKVASMGLVPTKLPVFSLRRKIPPFCMYTSRSRGGSFRCPLRTPRGALFPTGFSRRLGRTLHSERGTPDTPCGVPDGGTTASFTCPRRSPSRA